MIVPRVGKGGSRVALDAVHERLVNSAVYRLVPHFGESVVFAFLPFNEINNLHVTFLSFFLFPIFFGLTARVIPLRSGLRVFCFVGSALNNTGFPPTKQRNRALSGHACRVCPSFVSGYGILTSLLVDLLIVSL